MAPEILQHETRIASSADMWSFGWMLLDFFFDVERDNSNPFFIQLLQLSRQLGEKNEKYELFKKSSHDRNQCREHKQTMVSEMVDVIEETVETLQPRAPLEMLIAHLLCFRPGARYTAEMALEFFETRVEPKILMSS
jgi:hypothetical protein